MTVNGFCFSLAICLLIAQIAALDGDPPELQECRALNKGKWCTCRKLVKYVEKHQLGKRVGVFIPLCGKYHKKLYALKQCYNNHMECWCVSPKTGLMIEGTKQHGAASLKVTCPPPKYDL